MTTPDEISYSIPMKPLFSAFIGLFHIGCGPSSVDVNIDKANTSEPQEESIEEDNSDSNDTAVLNCDEVPYVTWDNWVHGAFSAHCQGCHATTSLDRYGAPARVVFDTESDAIDWLERIDIRVLQEQTMPPAGGLLPDELTLLKIWLRCWN